MRACYACGGPTDEVRMRLDRARVDLCRVCGHGITVSSATNADDRVYGAKEDSLETYERIYGEARAASFRCGLHLLGAPTSGTLLDIGCGYGHFLALAQTRGWTVRGYEPAAGVRARAVPSVAGSITASLEDAVAGVRIDAITLWDSLEHTADPRFELRRVYEMLLPGGQVLIRVPDTRVIQEMGNGARHLRSLAPLYLKLAHPTNPEEHPHHFTPASLSALAREANLEPVTTQGAGHNERVVSARSRADELVRRALHRLGQRLPYEFTTLLRRPVRSMDSRCS